MALQGSDENFLWSGGCESIENSLLAHISLIPVNFIAAVNLRNILQSGCAMFADHGESRLV